MITTVFCASEDPSREWRAELLAHSWKRIGQPGELVRLMPGGRRHIANVTSPARVVETLPWNPHPFMRDSFRGYELPAALMEWLTGEPVDGTLLLLDASSVLASPIEHETEPGVALAAPWHDMPTGDGRAFGLHRRFSGLERFCVNRDLALAAVKLPVLIDARDARKIAARWLELSGIIRRELTDQYGAIGDADRIGYAIAAAECRIEHRLAALGQDTDGSENTRVIEYARPVETPRGEILWDPEVYAAWDAPSPELARPGAGRELLALLAEYVSLRESGAGLSLVRPRRCGGVREARLLDELHLEIPGHVRHTRLNGSAAAIWELCDGRHTLRDIAGALEERFDAPLDALREAVEATAGELQMAGAIELEHLA